MDSWYRVLSWLCNATGLASLFDMVVADTSLEALLAGAREFMNSAEVRVALGVRGDVQWELISPAVEAALHDGLIKSTKRGVEALLRGPPAAPPSSMCMLLYEGICDAQVGVVSVEAWLQELHWDGLAAFQDTPRAVWRQRQGSGSAGREGRLAGYVQKHGALVHVAVYAAGHMVPAEQGRVAQEMIEDWVFDKGLFSCDGAAA
jgi:vitellogenic carboxypeptidase-like protein